MSVKNFVQCGLVTPVATNTTELVLVAPTASYQYPDLAGGTLVIADSVARPTFYEIISYTHRIDNVLYGVVRAKEGTTARAWTGSVWIYQALTAKDYLDALALKANAANAALTGMPTAPTAAPGTNTNQIATMAALQAAIAALIESSPAALNTLNELAAALGDDPNFAATMNAALAGKEPSIAAGTAAQMWLGNKTWATVLSQVQAVLLTGLGAGSNSTILASDTLIAALAKIQNQLNNKAASSDSRLTDAREWTAAEVTQAEAEAGTLTTVRKWSPLRVWQAVLASSLTGINLTLGTGVTAADTVLIAIGKLQKQITDAATNLAGTVRATVLTGFVNTANTPIVAADSVLVALGKAQAQINDKAAASHTHSYLPLTGGTLTGRLNGTSCGMVGTGNDFSNGAYEVIGNGLSNTVFPTIGFHQPSVYASSLQLRGPADFRFYAQGAAAYANVTANIFYGTLAGNASSASTLSGDQSSWASIRSNAVANMLGWNNYGNSHVIFDASKSISPSGSAVNNINATTPWTDGYPILMGWNGVTTYGVRVDSARVADSATGAGTATKLATARTINGVGFDGTANITLPNTDGTPAGAVMAFARSTAPAGWLKANGSAISRTTYSALFAAIGTTFGAGDGWSTFNLPDLRGEFLRGWDDARGIDSGRAFGTLQTDDLKWHTHTASTDAYAHTHTFSSTTSSAGGHGHNILGSNTGGSAAYLGAKNAIGVSGISGGTADYRTAPGGSTSNVIQSAGDHAHTVSGTTSNDWHTHTVTVNATGGTETRPRNLALLFCIKY